MDNCINVTKQLLKLLKVKHTNAFLNDNILSHQDYPSLLSIADTLTKYKIENIAIKISESKFDELPTPCIVQISNQGTNLFYILNKITPSTVSYFDDKNKLKEISREKFLKLWTRVCLLAETNASSKEIDIENKLTSQRFLRILLSLSVIFLSLWIIINFTKSDVLITVESTVYTIIFSILKLIGLTAGVFLLWFEVDQYNPTLQSFCTGGKNINCNAVLKSKYASLLNGNISLGLLSFSYFFTTIGYLVMYNFSSSTMALLAITSFITIPAITISLYYQAVIIKQWCKFCIVIQLTLICENSVVLLGGFYRNAISLETLPVYFVLFLLPILSWKLIKPLIEQQKESHVFKRGLKKIKANSFVLESLLAKSAKITHRTKGLGISITNKDAKYNVIKICNPYCGPCAKAHPILKDLIKKGSINLQVLFTATSNEKDYQAKPVRHFLAIDEQDKNKIQEALDSWYNEQHKDYDEYAKKYPMNGKLHIQNNKINAMHEWCTDEKITHTPTIFINGYKLPNEYNVEDLAEVLS